MKTGKIGAIILAIAIIVGAISVFLCSEVVPAGYVGVQYSLNGGIKDEVLPQGWHLVAPTIKVSEYSIATEQLLMTQDEREGSKDNDSFDVICKDGKLNVDFEMSYHFESDDVVRVFTKYRGMTGQDVVDSIIRNKVKAKISEVTSTYTVLEAHMDKKAELNSEITKVLQSYLSEYGITVESANLSATRPDEQIQQAITERSKVAQELEIEKQRQEKARLEAETKTIQAKAEADVKKIQTDADVDRYTRLGQAITPQLISKWEMDARQKHGWVTIQGANTVVK